MFMNSSLLYYFKIATYNTSSTKNWNMSTKKHHHHHKTLEQSDPGKIMDLVMALDEDTSAKMQVILNTYLMEECESELAFLVIVNGERMETSVETVGKTILDKMIKLCHYPKFSELLKGTAEQTELVSNFPLDLKNLISPYLPKDNAKKRVVMYPVHDKPFAMIVCVVAPKLFEDHVPTIIYECFLFTWTSLKKTLAYEYEFILKQKCQQLLRVARRLFTQVASLDSLLLIAMEQAKALTKAARCTVRLIDVDKMELYDNYSENRFPIQSGISGNVIATGNLVNTTNAKDHPAFDETVDGFPGVESRTILCFPIRERAGIIGVGQLINKVGDPYFTAMDEEMALAFSIYCGVCVMHSIMYQKVQEAHIRSALANELVMYHMKVGDAEVAKLMDCSGFHCQPHLSSLHFNPRVLPLRELPCYAVKFFSDLGYNKIFNIKMDKLCRFVLYVRKSYRDVPYHSWLHAFNVAQWAYAALNKFKLVQNGYFSHLQGLMYLVAALTHDLDHRGTTNSFQLEGQTTLAALYSSEGSVMERHHLAQAMCILNTEGCDILETLSRRDYDRALLLLRDFILATDLTNYFKNLTEYQTIAVEFQKGNKVHAVALQCLLMNAADLSDQLKDWQSVKKTAAAVLSEFFKQGDVEKSRGDLPQLMMDRDKCFIPELQMQFLQATCIPLFDCLGQMLPKAASCNEIIESHIGKWDAARPIFAEVPAAAGLSVLLSPELDNLIEEVILDREEQRLQAEAEAAAAELAAIAEEEAKKK